MLGRRQRKQAAARRTDVPWKRVARSLAAVLLLVGLAAPALALAQTAAEQVTTGATVFGEATGLATGDIRTIVGLIINAFFGLLGTVAVVLLIYGGYIWMTSKGDASQINKAKGIIVNTLIGLAIMMMAYAIVQFVFRAIFSVDEDSVQIGDSGGTTAITSGYCAGCGPEVLGNGIISYHNPEANQTDVPRNTSIAITFKMPVKPSTVLANYFDNDTYDTSDDMECLPDCADPSNTKQAITPTTAWKLNADNIKVLPAADLQEISGSSMDERFDSRYGSSAALGQVDASLTAVADPFDPNKTDQTLIIVPPASAPLGSSSSNVDYRVGLRGGESGLMAWNWDPEAGEPILQPAFANFNPDGSYFWNFTTGTLLDLTPPEITGLVPATVLAPFDASAEKLFRNQLLQVYFSKAMNPTTVSGISGTGGGFNLLEVLQETSPGNWQTIDGTWAVAAGYKAVEFIPSAACDGISANSCGDEVFCLPGNTNIALVIRAADLSDAPPRAAMPFNGLVDMVSNSMDTDANGTLEGQGIANPSAYTGNGALITGTNMRSNFNQDTSVMLYRVGNQLDLTPPEIVAVDPPNDNPGRSYREAVDPGASRYPPDRKMSADWSEPISISSIVTGPDSYGPATVVLRSRETKADGSLMGAPWFFAEPTLVSGSSRIFIDHRVFFTSNDLGWSPADQADPVKAAKMVPVYVPVFKSRIKDSRQNCFFPSNIFNCSVNLTHPFCCNDVRGSAMGTPCVTP